ncbi:hypothetical protein I2702_004795 [Vibrio parahaemolyticus]|nr:hypothetical protein [Vibrio parahaemolyticus]
MRLFLCLLMVFSSPAWAGYDKNIEGNITHIFTYPSGLVLFKLANQPTSHPTCNPRYFAIGSDLKEAAANRMFSRLLTLHTSKTPAYVGYDSQGNCADKYIRVHNVGGE